MDMQSFPDLEDLVEHGTEIKPYQSPDRNVEHAVSILQAHHAWVAEDRAEKV